MPTIAASWRAAATLKVASKPLGPFELDLDAPVTVGRSERCGIRSTDKRMPRELASLRSTPHGWIVENARHMVKGAAAPMRVHGDFIASRGGALFSPHALVLLQPGEWTIQWDLAVTVILEVTPMPAGAVDHRPARDKRHGDHGYGTLAPVAPLLTRQQAQRMAALFAYLIRGDDDVPRNRFVTGAKLAGCTERQLKSTRQNVQRKVNLGRAEDAQVTDLDELGYHLVDILGVIGEDDLLDPASVLPPSRRRTP